MELKTTIGRWGPLVILAGAMLAAYYFGLQNYVSLDYLIGKRAIFQTYVSSHLLFSIIVYATIYIAVVALSLPGAGILSIAGGFIFGWILSAPVTVIAATIGAILVFQIVKSSLGESLAKRASGFVARLSDGFTEDAFSYLLFLRLVPAFPFFIVNAVAGLCRINLRTFILATFIGIIPGAFVFAWVGRGLGSVIDAQMAKHELCVLKDGLNNCHYDIAISSLVTPQLLFALTALGIMALIPVAMNKMRGNR
jgi:uncharacterized membrane protein YdjX (TVP38/TMEM64 family)